MQVNVLVINRKHGALPSGTVCKDGAPIGRVFPHDRATGHAGANAGYWTACPLLPLTEPGSGPSLGTRFTSKRQAVEAVRDFDGIYPIVAMAARDFMPSFAYLRRAHAQIAAWKKGRKARYGF